MLETRSWLHLANFLRREDFVLIAFVIPARPIFNPTTVAFPAIPLVSLREKTTFSSF
jgi:hypothetical protein